VKKIVGILFVLMTMLLSTSAPAAYAANGLTFTNTPLLRPDGASEPAISIAGNGAMALTGLSWDAFFTHLWTGPFGSTPNYQGFIDNQLQKPGKRVFGGGDADVDLGSTGTLHASTLIFLVNPPFNSFKLGVSAITCKGGTSASFNTSSCTSKIIDTAGADRQWITSDGKHVYISYHDAGNSSLIHLQRSDDDGFTWKKVGDPIVGQGSTTGNATFNNIQGPIVADPFSHYVYDIYNSGEAGIQKATSAAFNNVIVSRSKDMGKTWRAAQVAHFPLFTDLSNVFPSLAVDPTNGRLYAVWSDATFVYFSTSSDQGVTWTPMVKVNTDPANTAIFPWVAALNGTVDVVYYGTTAASKDDTGAVWNVYLSQTVDNGASFTQSLVSNTPNHVGVVCTSGTACAPGTRNLLDLFEISINPQNGKAGIIYTDDTLTTESDGSPQPQVVLAQQQ
jgi:hypothetical protein